jgi:hypothetical protein
VRKAWACLFSIFFSVVAEETRGMGAGQARSALGYGCTKPMKAAWYGGVVITMSVRQLSDAENLQTNFIFSYSNQCVTVIFEVNVHCPLRVVECLHST